MQPAAYATKAAQASIAGDTEALDQRAFVVCAAQSLRLSEARFTLAHSPTAVPRARSLTNAGTPEV